MTDLSDYFDTEFADTRAMVILRGLGVRRSLEVAARAWDEGVRVLEVPVQHPEDLEALRAVVHAARDRGLEVGAGTLIDVGQVSLITDAGAAYAVSPGVDEAVIRAAQEAGMPTLPGVATASDIQLCRRLGLRWLKAFPASLLGPEWIRAMHGPFPDVSFVATGGMSPQNSAPFFRAGARVAGISLATDQDEQWRGLREVASGSFSGETVGSN